MSTSFKLLAVVVGLVVGFAASQIVTAQTSGQKQDVKIKKAPATAISSVAGKDTFAQYCAACHGTDARGTGPAAPALKTPPTDLTRLGMKYGKFDEVQVEHLIRGASKPLLAHGSTEMPIWGPIFRAMEPNVGSEALRMRNLVVYLKSIQAK